MIKKYILIALAAMTMAACAQYDDSPIWDKLKEHEDRIVKLEKMCENMNADIAAIRQILEALQDNDYVTGTRTLTEGGVVVGYIIDFSKSGSVTIYNGKDGNDGSDGEDGKTPVIGVAKDEAGVYCWTLDGEWILDHDGNRIPATGKDGQDGEDGEDGKDGQDGADGSDGKPGEPGADGQDGITPVLKIENDYWYVSYDNGATWVQLDKAVGDDGKDGESFFMDIDLSDPYYVILTMTDGQQIKIPTWKAFQELEAMVNGMNADLLALQAVVEALQDNDYVTGIIPIMENGKEVGYTICFENGEPINIYHGRDGQDGTPGHDGEDGKDGYTPSIGVGKDSDGVYYWTLDGEWMLDDSGNKIPCTGTYGHDGIDAVVPRLKIDNGYWYVSYDGGKTWETEPLGPTSGTGGNAFFTEVGYDEDYLYLTFSDGQEVKLPRYGNHGASILSRVDQVRISDSKATFSGQLNLEAGDFAYCQVILYYTTSGTFNIYNAKSISTMDFDEDGGFVISLTGLKVGEEYDYCICVKYKSEKVYTDVMAFVVPHPYAEIKSYDASAATDLSAPGTANCYIVTKTGLYKFRAVKGNSNVQLGGIASAEILWESFGTSVTPAFFELVEGVCYEDGYVVVKIADEFKEGNAVVAAKDAEGNVLWSWHIWMTDMPVGQVYCNNAGTVLDRSVGAVSATPGDVGTLGLYYQWGRKDPFLSASSISSTTVAKSTITWPAVVASDSFTGTEEYAAAHPTTFITFNDLNYDWLYTDAAAVDTTRWAVASAPKTVNDPCPYGWRIPEGGSDGVWGKALGIKSSQVYTFDDANKGMQMGGLLGADENIWYPAAGNLDHSNGKVIRVGTAGVCWAANMYKSTSHYSMCTYWTSAARFYVYDGGNRSRAFNARCVKEE